MQRTLPQPPIPPRLPRRAIAARKRRTVMPWLIAGGAAIIGASIIMAGIVLLSLLALSPVRVAQGVSIASMSVSGADEADVRAAVAELAARPVTVVDQDRQWFMTLDELGVRVDVERAVSEALRAERNATITPYYTIDLTQTQTSLLNLSTLANIPAIAPHNGRAMEIPVTLDRLRIDPTSELVDGVLELDMMVVEPPAPEATIDYNGELSTHLVQPGEELGLIARQYNVAMTDIVQINALSNPDLLFVGQELRIPAPGIYQPNAADAPATPLGEGRAIVVSTGDQRIYAYENGQFVRSHLVSTGRPETPTVLGDYRIYIKLEADDMSGPDYFLPQVPYTMYFYQGYAIHGTYWHNSFGRPMSHGCVNLPVDEAAWWFDFASVGTLVRVI
ncbi:MAG: L,D-transpeptidase family protein [Chloroflexota bacterium]|nr:L,D-transpeptidase family protein [Chloroflexota bacterium]